MVILVLGKTGQVARALARTVPVSIRGRYRIEFLDRNAADLSKVDELQRVVVSRGPALVINAAAYTAVDLAESNEAEAMRINALAPREIALACLGLNVPLIHYSTDYVFSGSGILPWRESDATGPLSVYGRSKAEGERYVREICPKHIILRTSWVYDDQGRNFVTTMLRLGGEREALRLVNDQIGAPTAAIEIARATWLIAIRLLEAEFHDWGTYHLAASGEASWHGFALQIFESANRLGLPLRVKEVLPIPSADYPTPARRPLNSRLSTEKIQRVFGITLPNWRSSLENCLASIVEKKANEGH